MSELIGADYFVKVVEVYLRGNVGNNLDALTDLPNLQGAFLVETDVADISVLSKLRHPKWVDVQYSTAIRDVTPPGQSGHAEIALLDRYERQGRFAAGAPDTTGDTCVVWHEGAGRFAAGAFDATKIP